MIFFNKKVKTMKQKLLIVTAIAALGLAGCSHGRRDRDGKHRFHAELLKQYDADGDGKLNDAEKKAAREGMKAKWAEKKAAMMKKFDTDGDGKLSDEEKKAIRENFGKRWHDGHKHDWSDKMKEKMMEKFDADGDGELSDDEKKAMRNSIKKQWKAKKAEKLKLYDADDDGELSKDERKAAHAAEKKKWVEKYDTDGDGEISAKEKKAAFKDMMKNNPMRLMHMMHDRAKDWHRDELK